MQTASVVLLSNAAATSPARAWPGGRGYFAVVANFGGGSVTLETLLPNGSTWAPARTIAGASATLTANGGLVFELPPGQIRAAVVTATGVHARVDRVPQ